MDLKKCDCKKQKKNPRSLTFPGLLIGSTHVVPPHRGYSAQAIWKKIALPNPLWWIFVGYAYMVQPNHLGQGKKKGEKRLLLHTCKLRTVITHMENVDTRKKEKGNVQQLSTSHYAV
jgi:hypothetical protein